jgi:hypothetical protein
MVLEVLVKTKLLHCFGPLTSYVWLAQQTAHLLSQETDVRKSVGWESHSSL